MKAVVKVEKEVWVTKINVNIAPRYIGDDEGDDIPTDFPLLNDLKNLWVADINIDTGKIENWKTGKARKLFAKVCDAGVYTLFDSDGNQVSRIDGYIPEIVPNEYGDYINLDIDEEGYIRNWNNNVSLDEFFD